MRFPPARTLAALGLALAACATPSAWAGPAADALGVCLAESSTGKERKELARWLFAGMAAHPAIQDLSKVQPADLEKASKTMAVMFTRLLTDACGSQTTAAYKAEGSMAMQSAFGKLGQVAMMELMSNPEVNAAMSQFERYVDQAKLQSTLGTTKP